MSLKDTYSLDTLERTQGVVYIGDTISNIALDSVADNGDGTITLTLASAHNKRSGDTLNISGTTSYNGLVNIDSVPSTTELVVTLTYVADESGTVAFDTAVGRFAGFEVINTPLLFQDLDFEAVVVGDAFDVEGLIANAGNLVVGQRVNLPGLIGIKCTTGDLKIIRMPKSGLSY